MKKTNPKKQSKKKKNNKVIFVVSGLSLTTIILIWIVYSLFSNWKNTLYIPQIPDLAGQSKVFENYIKKMHSAALENPESASSIGRLGMTFHANFFYEEAVRCYSRALNLNRREWRWLYNLALLNEELGDVQSTITNLKEVLEINPDVTQAWFRLGNAYLKQNAYKEALHAFNQVLAKQPFILHSTSNIKLSNKGAFPLKAYASLKLGRTELQQGNHDKARHTLTALIKSYPTFGSAYRLLSQVYFELGDHDNANFYVFRSGDFDSYLPPADIIFDDLIFYSRKIDFILKQIDLAIRSQNDDWAATLNSRIIEYKPEDKEVLTKLLKLSVDLHQREGVEAYGEVFSKMFRFDESKLLEMTRFLISREQYKLALHVIQQIKTINPESIGAHLEYVTILRNLKDFQKAVDYCKNLIVTKPDNPHIKIELARILIYLRKYNEAAEQLSLAEKIDPNNEAGLLLRGRLWRAQKNATKSIEFYRKYLQAHPTDVSINLELGNYYINLRDWKRALKHFNTTLNITPNHIDYIERYAWVLAACPNPRFRNGQKLMEFAERLLIMRKFTEDQELRSAMTVAVTFAELKDFDNALKIVNDNLIKLRMNNAEDYYKKFEALQRLFQANKPYRL